MSESSKKGSQSELAAFEEERRLFYVGMTRARNNLTIFRLGDAFSCLIREITAPVQKGSIVKPAGTGIAVSPQATGAQRGVTPRYAGAQRGVTPRVAGAKRDVTQRTSVNAGAYKSAGKLVSDYDLTEGEVVVSVQYGQGVVTEVKYDNDGRIDKFKVEFDSFGAKTFLFPIAFQSSMRLLSGEKVNIY